MINMSLSTTKRQFAEILHELADQAYFRRTVVVASAHNMPVESYPWRFSSVISVGSHEHEDPLVYYYNPEPPVEFFARGVGVDVAWIGGATVRATGNSFATPHMTGICALILGKHPGADAVPAEERPVLDGRQRGGWSMSEDRFRRPWRRACSPPRSSIARCCGRSSRSRGRCSPQGVLDRPARRGDRRARVRGGGRRGGGHADRAALSVRRRASAAGC